MPSHGAGRGAADSDPQRADGRSLYEFDLPGDARFKGRQKIGVSVYLMGEDGGIFHVFADGEFPPERLEYFGDGATGLCVDNELIYVLYGATGEIKAFDMMGAELAGCRAEGAASISPFHTQTANIPWRYGMKGRTSRG